MSNLIKENTIFDEVDKKCKSFISENPLLDVYKIKEAEEYFQKETLHKELEKGIEKGIEKNKIEIAKNLLDNNVDINVISLSTGLSQEEIKKLSR